MLTVVAGVTLSAKSIERYTKRVGGAAARRVTTTNLTSAHRPERRDDQAAKMAGLKKQRALGIPKAL